MTTLAPPGCTILEWDSAFWGKMIGRGHLPVQEADECAQSLGLDCLYLLIPIEEISEAHEAVRRGFRLVDVRVQFELKPRPARLAFVREFRDTDLVPLAQIARTSFRRTRFYNDPRFEDSQCDALYETWTRNACANDSVLVAERDDKICGYVTLSEDGDLVLIAVAAEARQQGIGSSLMRGALDWAYVRRLETLSVVTQGGNLPAQRLFQAQGGRSKSVGLWFHRWYDGA